MYSFTTNREDIKSELNDIIRQFYSDVNTNDFFIEQIISADKKLVNKIIINSKEYLFEYESIVALDSLEYKRLFIRLAKISLYKALQEHCGRNLPWGALTGVRPTKLAYEALEKGIEQKNIADYLQKNFLVSREKSVLVADIISSQSGNIERDTNKVNLYIHIPLCPSRCYYCSFVSVDISKQKKYIKDYVIALKKEIIQTCNIIFSLGKTIHSIYIGGGTPTVLDEELFEDILSAMPKLGIEFTCEAGRPDTITKEKLDIMKRHGVTRISVNPQTLNNKTLQAIGRNHTYEDFLYSYNLAKSYGFIINTDLIAGLKNEDLSDFCYSLDNIILLKPHNITVHTLSRKNGSELKVSGLQSTVDSTAEFMMEYAHKKLNESEYRPYYLYRQKLMLNNLENAGYSLKGYECVNNITTMEETLSVFACGAGGITKTVLPDGRIERLANLKEIKLYLEQFDDRLDKKIKFCQNQFTSRI